MRTTKTLGRGTSRSWTTRLVALLVLLSLLLPTVAQAATPYTISWISDTYPDSSTYGLGYKAGAYFTVNGTPLYTLDTAPGPVSSITHVQTTEIDDNFDSTLLTAGANAFVFGVTVESGDNSSVHTDERVGLLSQAAGVSIPLFRVTRSGTSYTGTTTLSLSLAQVNPPLNKDIASLTAAITAEETALDANASKVPNLAALQTELGNLQNDLASISNEPLDEISATELDALLTKYSDVVSPSVRSALEQFVSDLKQSVAALQAQLTQLVQQFSQLATNVANLATQGVGGGWNPDDPNNYSLTSDPSSVPDIPSPDFSQTAGAFDPNNDPYKAYADAIVARLGALAQSGGIPASQRPQFVSVVRGWRQNELALQNAINTRVGVSQAETNAFLNAQNRVIAAIRAYMDQNDWFLQNPVAPVVRQFVDGVLKAQFGALAQDVKDALNQWSDSTPTPDETLIAGTVGAIGAAASDPDLDDIADYDTRPAMLQALAQARSIARGYVLAEGGPLGVFVSLCEAAWGKEFCTSSGKPMSVADRVVSGVSGAIATAAFWMQFKAFAGMAQVGDETAQVATLLDAMPLATRQALISRVGVRTLTTMAKVAPDSFAAFAQAALGNANPIMTSSQTVPAEAMNAAQIASGWYPGWIAQTETVSGYSVANQYIRAYKAGKNYPTGYWIMSKDEIMGLTAAQVKDRFALPEVPDMVVDVNFPAGQPIVMGVAAGSEAGNPFGAGGGMQIFWDAKVDFRSPQVAGYFVNARPIKDVVR